MKRTLLNLITLLITLIGYSQMFTAQDSYGNTLNFNITSSNTVSVTTGSTIVNTNVNIPSSVSNGGINYTVTAIGQHSFSSNNSISNVSIPNTVTSIEKLAFSNCSLTSVVLPNGLTTIGEYAFQDNQLQSITIPSSVTSIGNGTFRTNIPLTKVTCLGTIPPSITTINGSNDSFYQTGGRGIIDLIIPAGTTAAYVTDPGALWTGFNSVTEFFINNSITYYITSTSPNEVKATDYNTSGGITVTVPATVSDASIPYTVKRIEDFAFYNNGLTNVTIANGIETIGKSAFKNNAMTSIIIPNSVTDIDENAFENNQLQTATLSNALTEIKSYAFQNNALNTVTIPSNVTKIQKYAFYSNQLTALTIPSNVTTIYQRAFMNNQIANLTLENGIQLIYFESFKNNQLASLIVPNTVNELGGASFQGNPLTSITSARVTAPNITTDANLDTFTSDRSSINLTIPLGSMDSYVTGSNAKWTGFNSVTEDGTLNVDNLSIEGDVNVSLKNHTIKIIPSSTINFKNYHIYTITGQEVVKGNSNEINVSTLSDGTYILKLIFDKGILSKKFMK